MGRAGHSKRTLRIGKNDPFPSHILKEQGKIEQKKGIVCGAQIVETHGVLRSMSIPVAEVVDLSAS